MKKTTILMAALIMLVVSAPQQAQAGPMYYTFEGTVSSFSDGAGAIAAQMPGLVVGSTVVTYTVILDFAADGTRTYNDVTVDIYTTSSPSAHYFYADAYSGDYLSEVDGGYFHTNDAVDVAEYNWGRDYSGSGSIGIKSDDDPMRINSPSIPFSSLIVGQTGILGRDNAYDSAGGASLLLSSLTLISKSASPPPASVPEPSTLLLLGSGLLGLGMFRRGVRKLS